MNWLNSSDKITKKFTILLFSLLLSIYLLPFSSINLSKADAFITRVDCSTGGIIPSNYSHDLMMTNADVTMDINVIDYKKEFQVNFEGTYTIYNPNSTVSYYIAAPFTEQFSDLSYSLSLKVNNTDVNYIIDYLEQAKIIEWNEYFYGYYSSRIFIISNITFQEKTNTVIEYKWNSTVEIDLSYSSGYYSPQETILIYDVGTSRSWNGNITEHVEFKIHGRQPSSYTGYSENMGSSSFQVIKTEKGKSYLWEWEDEIIEENSIGVIYDYKRLAQKNNLLIILYTIFFLVLVINMIFLTLIIIKGIKRKRESK